jgi:hypothetical protein
MGNTIICHNSFTKHFESYRNPVRNGRLWNNHPYRLPAHLTRTMSASTIPCSIALWHELPRNIKEVRSRNSFKFNVRIHPGGKKNPLISTKFNLERKTEIVLNKARCDLIFIAHLFSHNFSIVPDPSCHCGFRALTTISIYFYVVPCLIRHVTLHSIIISIYLPLMVICF